LTARDRGCWPRWCNFRDIDDSSPTSDEVLLALGRVLASDTFAGSSRNSGFLAFVVTETVAGRGARLSERTVGRYALQRPDDFDGRFDSSVRVRALRVRKALDTYYATADDPVQIVLPAGSYTPYFERVEPASRPRTETAVVVTHNGQDASGLAETISQEMVHQCAAFPGLLVIGPVPTSISGPVGVAKRLGVRFALDTATSAEDGMTTVKVIVVDATSDAIIWTVSERFPDHEVSGFDVTQWSQRIAGQIGDYTGVILTRSVESHLTGEDEWRAMQSYYLAFIVGDTRAVNDATASLEAAVGAGRRSPTLVAALAHCLAVRAGYGFSDDIEADLREAAELAHEALAADPESSTAYMALATAALVSGDTQGAVEFASKAALCAPNHPSTLATSGTLTAYAGQWDKGMAMIRRSLHLNPGMPSAVRYITVLDHMFAGDDALALAEASLITIPSEAWGPYFRALALMGLGYRERALAEMDAALEVDPALLDDVDHPVDSWIQLTPDQSAVLTERLRMFLPG
jgi:TolB-like protein